MSKDLKFAYEFSIYGFYFCQDYLYFGSTKPYQLIQIQNNLKNKLSSIHVNFYPIGIVQFYM